MIGTVLHLGARGADALLVAAVILSARAELASAYRPRLAVRLAVWTLTCGGRS